MQRRVSIISPAVPNAGLQLPSRTYKKKYEKRQRKKKREREKNTKKEEKVVVVVEEEAEAEEDACDIAWIGFIDWQAEL